MTNKKKGLIAIIISVLFWGFSFISIKVSVAVFPPMTLGMIRFAIALIFLYFLKLKMAPKERFVLKDIPLLCGAAITGVTLYFYFENTGVSMVSASEASIIVAAVPVLTMIAEYLGDFILYKRAMKKAAHDPNTEVPQRTILGARRWIGALVSVLGVWFVVGATLTISGSAVGYLFMLGSAISWVFYSFLTRRLSSIRSNIYIVFWQSLFGFIGFIPFALSEMPQWGTPTLGIWAHIVFLAIFCSALAYWLNAMAIGNLGVGIASMFINLIPVVTVIFGFFLLGDRLSILQWIGAVLVMAGVYLAMMEKRKAA
ncbi:MAG: DMT family transporter [Treponema sp.]|jgi:drug/metabolite transporter (DMT)-like permease|nr:DMT family transporter [Treponema sp.]